MFQLTIIEEAFGSGTTTELPVTFSSEHITLSDLIMRKVSTKVEQLNRDAKAHENANFFTSKKEKQLNAVTIKGRARRSFVKMLGAKVDPERAGYEALYAFKKNAFFVLVDDEQRDDLEEELFLTQKSRVRFIRLLPLVGG
jgi:hypothetical protein